MNENELRAEIQAAAESIATRYFTSSTSDEAVAEDAYRQHMAELLGVAPESVVTYDTSTATLTYRVLP